MTTLTVIGLISGTSADGIDAALVRIGPGATSAERRIKLLAFRTTKWPAAIRRRILEACAPGGADAREISQLSVMLAERFAAAARGVAAAADLPMPRVDLIGSHGQTLVHGPSERPAHTLQIGDPSVIAEHAGCTVVAQFRSADMAAGGEGAPLVPLAHALLFRKPRRARAVQNLGGIGNVTVLPPGRGTRDVTAFDTGPANMVIDGIVSATSGGRFHMDRGGRRATRGRVDDDLLEEFLTHPFFRQRPPKSTGRRTFGEGYVRRFLQRARARSLSADDAVATATALTVECIARAYERWVLPHTPLDEAVFCGGGVHNRALMRRMAQRLGEHDIEVTTTDAYGVDPDAVEAVSFAVLAHETWNGRPGNVTGGTGARGPRTLGVIAPGPNLHRLRKKGVT